MKFVEKMASLLSGWETRDFVEGYFDVEDLDCFGILHLDYIHRLELELDHCFFYQPRMRVRMLWKEKSERWVQIDLLPCEVKNEGKK